jgi:hypothetical protein
MASPMHIILNQENAWFRWKDLLCTINPLPIRLPSQWGNKFHSPAIMADRPSLRQTTLSNIRVNLFLTPVIEITSALKYGHKKSKDDLLVPQNQQRLIRDLRSER